VFINPEEQYVFFYRVDRYAGNSHKSGVHNVGLLQVTRHGGVIDMHKLPNSLQ